MSQLHVNHINGFLHRTYDGLIDLSDVKKAGDHDREKIFLTRSLAAFSIAQLADISPQEASATITDGPGDNGIDAIYYHQQTKSLYVVQSKWFGDGHGSFDRADMLKFTKGFEDLTSIDFSRFNNKIAAKEPDVTAAFYDDQATYTLVAVYTGQEALAMEPRRDLQDCLDKYNDSLSDDARELLRTRILSQSDVHGFITSGAQGIAIDLDVMLHGWGEVTKPYAIYGQVSAVDVAKWWARFYQKKVAENIRTFLGTDTEVNVGLQNTLLNAPENFWHYNNGITVTCREIKRTVIGGPTKDAGLFRCLDVSIVNGAQTAGSIAAAYAKKPQAVEQARVPVRFIAVGTSENADFGLNVTRATNTQNRITRQDFAALDIEQERIASELLLEGVHYNFKSGEGAIRSPVSFGFEEAVVALACSHPDLNLSTQAKREVGKLWEDITKAPYRMLFNPSTTGNVVWRKVQIMRLIEIGIQGKMSNLDGREKGYAIHGNRFVAHKIFRSLSPSVLNASEPSPSASQIAMDVGTMVDRVSSAANQAHPGAYLAQLFKNHQKLILVDRRM